MSHKIILLIEDDPRIRMLLPRYFQREHMILLTAASGQQGLAQLASQRPDLLLLDVNLPDIDGWSILRRIRQSADSELPIIMLTGRSDVPDRLLGLELGADDYIVKPFDPLEVIARVKAVLRRSLRQEQGREILDFPGLSIDLSGQAVQRGEKAIKLTAKEFALLAALAQGAGRVLTRQSLYDIGWGEDGYADDHTLDVTINRLREKLAAPDGYRYIITMRGIGYKFEVEHDE